MYDIICIMELLYFVSNYLISIIFCHQFINFYKNYIIIQKNNLNPIIIINVHTFSVCVKQCH